MTHNALRRVYLGASLQHLLSLITDQGQEILDDAGIEFSFRAAPIVLLLMQRGPLAAADIARTLGDQHQLVTQRVDALIAAKMVSRVADPADARRKVLKVTAKGHDQLKRLKTVLERIEAAYAALFAALGVDMAAKTLETIEALERLPLQSRIESEDGRARHTASARRSK